MENPWDKDLICKFLSELPKPLHTSANYFEWKSPLPPIRPRAELPLGKSYFKHCALKLFPKLFWGRLEYFSDSVSLRVYPNLGSAWRCHSWGVCEHDLTLLISQRLRLVPRGLPAGTGSFCSSLPGFPSGCEEPEKQPESRIQGKRC